MPEEHIIIQRESKEQRIQSIKDKRKINLTVKEINQHIENEND